jgi:hypothetical protein
MLLNVQKTSIMSIGTAGGQKKSAPAIPVRSGKYDMQN